MFCGMGHAFGARSVWRASLMAKLLELRVEGLEGSDGRDMFGPWATYLARHLVIEVKVDACLPRLFAEEEQLVCVHLFRSLPG